MWKKLICTFSLFSSLAFADIVNAKLLGIHFTATTFTTRFNNPASWAPAYIFMFNSPNSTSNLMSHTLVLTDANGATKSFNRAFGNISIVLNGTDLKTPPIINQCIGYLDSAKTRALINKIDATPKSFAYLHFVLKAPTNIDTSSSVQTTLQSINIEGMSCDF